MPAAFLFCLKVYFLSSLISLSVAAVIKALSSFLSNAA